MSEPMQPKQAALRLSWSAVNETGARAANEDSVGAARSGELACFVVADGAGGHQGGAIASSLVRDAVLAAFCAAPDTAGASLAAYVDAASAAVASARAGNAALAEMSSTAAVLVVDQQRGLASWAHLGDSRIYLLRAGAVLHASRDHSLVQQLIDGGLAAPTACRDHPQRHLLLAAVGADDGVAPAVSAEVALQAGDALLVCSDGLWEWIDEAAMLATLPDSGRSEDWLAGMCAAAASAAAAAAVKRPDSVRDNFSAYAIRVHGREGAA